MLSLYSLLEVTGRYLGQTAFLLLFVPPFSSSGLYAQALSGSGLCTITNNSSGTPVDLGLNLGTTTEAEPNDAFGTAQFLTQFGSANTDINRLTITGTSGSAPTDLPAATNQEDDGAIAGANRVPFTARNQRIAYSAVIGDGPNGNSSGDFDVYAVTMEAGTILNIDVDFATDRSTLISVYDGSGTQLAANLDIFNPAGAENVNTLSFTAPSPGTFYVAISTGSALGLFFYDVFNSGSGSGSSPGGLYTLTLTYSESDDENFSFDLRAGDVFGASLNGSGKGSRLALFDAAGELVISTRTRGINDGANPAASPLNTSGQVTLGLVIPTAGVYTLEVSSNVVSYALELLATRPLLEHFPGKKQVIFLDFTGGPIDASSLLPDTAPGTISTTTGLADFMDNLSLPNTDANRIALATRITEVVRESLVEDLEAAGINPNFGVELISDLADDDLAATWTDEALEAIGPVSRVVIGGGISTGGIGRTSSIDVGNFELRDLAFVNLFTLSNPDPGNVGSLLNVPRAPGIAEEEAFAVGVGNVVAHEIGHFLGNFHQDNSSGSPITLMDAGSGPFPSLGLRTNSSEAFGSGSEIDPDFIADRYSPDENYEGTSFSAITTAYALSCLLVSLPVSLRSFGATVTGPKSVRLDWFTDAEINNRGFSVQHATTAGGTFRTIGFVAARGPGSAYDFVHTDPVDGANYYRLQQEDLDGTTERSAVRTVTLRAGTEAVLRIIPNPARDFVYLDVTPDGNATGQGQVSLYDAVGRLVREKVVDLAVGAQRLPLSLADLPSGQYVVRLATDSGDWAVEKLTVR